MVQYVYLSEEESKLNATDMVGLFRKETGKTGIFALPLSHCAVDFIILFCFFLSGRIYQTIVYWT
jgi:hypothetical protein